MKLQEEATAQHYEGNVLLYTACIKCAQAYQRRNVVVGDRGSRRQMLLKPSNSDMPSP